MSASANIVFFGIRIFVPWEEFMAGGLRKHHLVVRAREFKLHTYYTNFGGIDPMCYLLIGRKIGITGPEDEDAVELSSDELLQIISQVREKLQAAKFDIAPKLYTMWIPDA